MLTLLLKGVAYALAPRATLAVLHPRATLQLAATPVELRHGLAPRITAAAAVAVALPVGILIGMAIEQTLAARAARGAGDSDTAPELDDDSLSAGLDDVALRMP